MKGNLSFTLPEEQEAFDIASHAFDVGSALWHFKQYLRTELKHPKNSISKQTIEKLEEVQQFFLEEFNRFAYDD